MTPAQFVRRAPNPSRIYAWFVVGILWVVVVTNYVDRQAIYSVFPLLRSEIGASDLALGSMASVFLWVYGGISPLAGYLGDLFHRRTVILGSLILWSCVTFATGFATTSAGIIFLRGLMGISEACYMPAGLAMITDYHGPRHRAAAVALHQSGIYVGIIVGGVFAGYMGDHLGWRYAFYALGLLGVLLAIVLGLVLRDAPREVTSPTKMQVPISLRRNYAALLRTPTILILCAVVLIYSIYFWILTVWLPLFFFQEFSMTLTKAAFTATAYSQLSSVAGILIGGVLSDHLRRYNLRARMWVQFFGTLIPAPFLLVMGFSRSLQPILFSLVVFGLGRGLWDCNNMPVICDVTPAEMRASAYGLYNFAGMCGGGVGTLVVGALASKVGLRALISSTAPLAVLAGIIIYVGAVKFLKNDMFLTKPADV
jgi:MFS transporter, Spinster family, sphingosine-1-phosphate transporter